MCNPSKKTIKRIEQMLETRCKKVQKFEQLKILEFLWHCTLQPKC